MSKDGVDAFNIQHSKLTFHHYSRLCLSVQYSETDLSITHFNFNILVPLVINIKVIHSLAPNHTHKHTQRKREKNYGTVERGEKLNANHNVAKLAKGKRERVKKETE